VFVKHLARVTPKTHIDYNLINKAKVHLEARASQLEDKREDGRMQLIVDSARLKNIESSLITKKVLFSYNRGIINFIPYFVCFIS